MYEIERNRGQPKKLLPHCCDFTVAVNKLRPAGMNSSGKARQNRNRVNKISIYQTQCPMIPG